MRYKGVKLATVLLTFLAGVTATSFLRWANYADKPAAPVISVYEPLQFYDLNLHATTAAVSKVPSNHDAVFGGGKLRIVPATVELESERLRYKISAIYPQVAGSEELYIRNLNQHIKNLIAEQYQWQLNPSKADLKYYRQKWPEVFNSVELDYEIRLADDRFLSIYFEGYSYGIGAAHSVPYSFTLNYDLARRRELKLHDLFDHRSKYLEFISRYCKSELSKKADLLFDDVLRPASRTFASWNITSEGIRFNFDACSVFGCASGKQVVFIPFNELKHLLNRRWQELPDQSWSPRTVLDYYLMLPDKYFEASKEQRVKWMLDSSRGAVVDLKKGIIFAVGDGAQASIHVCLFKADGSPLVVVKWHEADNKEYTHVDFLEYRLGALMEVGPRALPVDVRERCNCETPSSQIY